MRLKNQLTLLFFTITFITLVVAELLIFLTVREVITNQVTDQLRAVSSLKAYRISTLFKNNTERVFLMNSRQNMLVDLKDYLNTGNKDLLEDIHASLNKSKEGVKNFNTISIVALNGMVISTTDSSLINADLSSLEAFIKAKRGESVVDEFLIQGDRDLQQYLAGPLVLDGDSLGVILIKTEAENLERVLADSTGLGETGETMLVRRVHDDTIMYVSPLRFQGRELMQKYGRMENSDLLAYNKQGLYIDEKDYRNEEVMGAVIPLPDKEWFVISKIDKEEALAPLQQTRNFFISIGVISLIVVSIVSFLFGKRLSKPINKLTGVAEEMSHGDFSKRSDVKLNNEIGELANAFNIMAGRLEQLKAEDQRKVALLKSSNEALNHFAYVISHDLKAPVKNIEGLLPILQEVKVEEGKEEYFAVLDMIRRKVIDSNDLIEGVLDYARLGSSGSLPKEMINSRELVKDIVSTLNPPAHIRIHIQENLPVVCFPRIPLKQIFQNLLSNAIKFSDKPEGRIMVGESSSTGFWKFWVKDNGHGIAEKDFEKIFGMFKFIKKKEEVESSGIGLGVVKKIITENGGEIWVESEPGKGSVFYFTIPKEA